jgi:asparagine synthase (glutamine-hydrolysing)
MCGIAGLFDTRGKRDFAPALLGRMTDSIAHRGPDGSGLHQEPGLGLGHRRLAIIDIGGGHQPMHTADRALSIVFNGEIYNFLELRAELEGQGAVFVTHSDTEVLLHGWRIWGVAMLPKLQGMFAFALWDVAEQTLILARDRFGKKPIYYSLLDDGTLAFGSELKCLLNVPQVGRTLDREAVSDFFTYGYIPDPKSIYTSVRKLPAAHFMVARKGAPTQIKSYWTPLEALGRPAEVSTEVLVEKLDAAVRSRLISDVPLGALLSGGVDSSAVVALMAGQMSTPVKTFSIGFGERQFDETGYAQAVADRYGTDHDVREVSADDFSLIDRLADVYDEPFGDISAIPTFQVCAQARRKVTVALTGDGGDEVLAGYRRHKFHYAAERVRGLAGPRTREVVFGKLADLYPHASWLPRPLRAKATFREWSLDSASAYARILSALPQDIRSGLLHSDFQQSLGGYDSGDVVRDVYNVDAALDPLQRAQYADLMTYLPGDILTKVDRASMANSLELRAPMLDVDFFNWSFVLPPAAKITRQGGGKAILKQAMEAYLPSDLLYRPKQGFSVPLASWLRGPLRDQLLALAGSAHLRDCGMIDIGAVEAMAKAHIGGLRDYSKPLWLIWVFDAFLRRNASLA